MANKFALRVTILKIRAHIFIKGLVQGVSFRYWAIRQADKFDVTGWIRNLYDGRVEAVFEGERNSVEKMIEVCRRGPSGAVVRDLATYWEEYSGVYEDFHVEY